ncbi:serine/threonine/tyrosine-interacting protein-like [Lingula anatina]|uniref:Serine/threonine/tyrosine-interacting protein-like n=1 Tax=Lingula anatina TaxID=7574 RepID=A0A1S3J3N8_LINAN|nr:serine/threonine/tyrosine-interacting protein-like [Lingula anatina]|eukprot:XP_023931702.1 serine/threonine/tyrosine-interacting protein-like [Lingula anatina]
MMMETSPMPSSLPSTDMRDTDDWQYQMRWQMQEILPGLYLGPYAVANKSRLNYLKEHQITHVLCIRQTIEGKCIRPNFPDDFKYMVLDISDSVTENIIQHIPKVNEFLDECLSKGGRALVHGNAGISRSAAFVVAYVMERFGLSFRDAFRHVLSKRFCISLNEGFIQQLKEYEPIYKARLIFQNGEPSPSSISGRTMNKRKFVEDSEMDTDDTDDMYSASGS